VRTHEIVFSGVSDDDPDYTAKELVHIAEQLIALRTRFYRYLSKADLIAKRGSND
jgi:hypothetical protein